MTSIFTENVTLPQVFFRHFASKNQLPGFYIKGALVGNMQDIWCIYIKWGIWIWALWVFSFVWRSMSYKFKKAFLNIHLKLTILADPSENNQGYFALGESELFYI